MSRGYLPHSQKSRQDRIFLSLLIYKHAFYTTLSFNVFSFMDFYSLTVPLNPKSVDFSEHIEFIYPLGVPVLKSLHLIPLKDTLIVEHYLKYFYHEKQEMKAMGLIHQQFL